ncbi:hypothetical protein V2J09_004998 [Rumex salicifolius]
MLSNEIRNKSFDEEEEEEVALLHSERKRADELQKKCLRALDSSFEMKNEVAEEDKATNATKENTEEIMSLTSEIYNLKELLQSEGERADALEKKYVRAEEISLKKQDHSFEEETSLTKFDSEKMELIAEIDKLKKQIRSLEDEFVAAVVKENPIARVDTELLIAEVDELKALVLSEREQADDWRKKFLRAEEICNEKQKEKNKQEEEGTMKEASVSAVDTEKIESLTAELDELKALLKLKTERAEAEGSSGRNHKEPIEHEQEAATITDVVKEASDSDILLNSERQRANEWEKKCLRHEESSSERQKKSADEVEEKEEEAAVKEDLIKLIYIDKLESLAAEIDRLENLLHTEKERVDEWLMKFIQARESNNEMQEQLVEAEERIQQLEKSSS